MDHKLVAFLSVARNENFSRAAEELHMSQPAVSQQIRALEQELGVKLFERSTKSVSLTRAGKIVEHYGKEIETSFGAMKRRLEELTDIVAGPLMIGASYTVGEYVLPYAAAEFCHDYPEVKPGIQISNTQHVAEMIQEDTIDIGIVEGEVDLPGVTLTELMRDRMVVIASPSHPVANQGDKLLESDKTTWILRETGSGTRAASDKVLDVLKISVQSKMEFSSTQAIKASVQAGLGVSVLSELAIQRELDQKTLVVIPTGKEEQFTRPFYLLRRESAFKSRVAEAFREFLAEYVRICYPEHL